MARNFRFNLIFIFCCVSAAAVISAIASNTIVQKYRRSYAASIIESNGKFFTVKTEYGDEIGISFERHSSNADDLPNLNVFSEISRISLTGLGINDQTLGRALENRDLRWLYLVNTSVTEAGLRKLRCKKLRRLFLSGLNVTDGHLASLQCLEELNYLQIINAKNISGKGLAFVPNINGLKSLDIGYLNDGVVVDARRFRNLGLTNLRICNLQVSSEDIAAIAKMNSLEMLALPGTGVSDKETESLSSLPQLRVLDLSGCPVGDDSAKYLVNLELEELDIRWTNFSARGIAWFSRLKSLRWLTISNSAMTDNELLKLKLSMPQCVVTASSSANLFAAENETSSATPVINGE